MRHIYSGFLYLIITSVVWIPSANAQAADQLLEFLWETTEPLYAQDARFERVLIDAEFADELTTLEEAMTHPGVFAIYELAGARTNGQWLSLSTPIAPKDRSFVPEGVAAIAEAYRPEPRSILEGYMAFATASKADGVVAYTIPANGDAPAYTLLVDDTLGRITGADIGDEPYRSLGIRYEYDASGAIARIVVEFATNEHPDWRWALVDFPVESGEPPTLSQPFDTTEIDGLEPAPRQPASSPRKAQPKDGIVTAPVEFASSEDLIDPIDLGTTSCEAAEGACFDFIGLDVCFNIGLGVALHTNTAITMNGNANVEYPIGDREGGDARVTFTGANGTSSIDYSFAYDAEICAAVTVPVLGTCNSSFVLAQGSVTAAAGEQAFSPFLLPGDSERPVCTGDAIDPLFVGLERSVTLCDLELGFMGGLNIDPNLDYCISGGSMVIKNNAVSRNAIGGKVSAEIFSEAGEAWIPVIEGPNAFAVDWNGAASLAGSLTLAPVLGVTIPGIGDIALPLPSVMFPLGNVGIGTVAMSDTFEATLCSAPPRYPYRVGASKGAAVDRVVVQWEHVTAATGYRVFRARKADLSDARDISGVISERQFGDTTATTGMGGCIEGTGAIEYYYYVVAVNDCGESAPSHAVVGHVAEPKSLASLDLAGFGDFVVFAGALAALYMLRRRGNWRSYPPS